MYNDYLFPFKTIPLLLIKTRTLKNQKHLIFLTLKNYLLQETFLPQSTTQTFRNPQRAQSIQATLVNRLHVNLASLQSTVVTSEKEKGRKWCDKPQTRLPHAIKSRQKKSKRERERETLFVFCDDPLCLARFQGWEAALRVRGRLLRIIL